MAIKENGKKKIINNLQEMLERAATDNDGA